MRRDHDRQGLIDRRVQDAQKQQAEVASLQEHNRFAQKQLMNAQQRTQLTEKQRLHDLEQQTNSLEKDRTMQRAQENSKIDIMMKDDKVKR